MSRIVISIDLPGQNDSGVFGICFSLSNCYEIVRDKKTHFLSIHIIKLLLDGILGLTDTYKNKFDGIFGKINSASIKYTRTGRL